LRFLKIDVEGMEEEVLRGASDTIRRLQPLLYVENDRFDRSLSLMTCLEQLGYLMYWHTPPLFNPDNFRRNPVNEFPGVVSVNLFCVHRDSGSAINGLPPARPGDRPPGVASGARS